MDEFVVSATNNAKELRIKDAGYHRVSLTVFFDEEGTHSVFELPWLDLFKKVWPMQVGEFTDFQTGSRMLRIARYGKTDIHLFIEPSVKHCDLIVMNYADFIGAVFLSGWQLILRV